MPTGIYDSCLEDHLYLLLHAHYIEILTSLEWKQDECERPDICMMTSATCSSKQGSIFECIFCHSCERDMIGNVMGGCII